MNDAEWHQQLHHNVFFFQITFIAPSNALCDRSHVNIRSDATLKQTSLKISIFRLTV